MQTTWSSFSGNTAATTSAVTTNDTSDTPSTLFTTLLVAQIRNQNPLEPTDPSEFVGQLTQLSQMEALQNLVSQGSVTASMLESLQVLTLGSQVGSRVTVATDSVRVADQQPVEGSVTLSSAMGSTAVVLSSALHRESLIGGMLHGYKRADGPTGARQRVWVGVILLAVVLAILMGWIPVPGIRAGASLLS